METAPLTRAYLETLTTGELLKIADSAGMDIPDNYDRILIIEELLEITSQEEDESASPRDLEVTGSDLTEAVPLPKQYNITFIEVLIRDPLWAFVFWEIKASDREQLEKSLDFEGYYLKVSPLEDSANSSRGGNEGLFKVPVKPEDTAWYLSLSPAFEVETSWSGQSQFKVEFCAGVGGGEAVLAVSNPISLPGLPELPSGAGKQELQGAWGNPLVRLSGYGNFNVLRKKERPLRTKRGEGDNLNE